MRPKSDTLLNIYRRVLKQLFQEIDTRENVRRLILQVITGKVCSSTCGVVWCNLCCTAITRIRFKDREEYNNGDNCVTIIGSSFPVYFFRSQTPTVKSLWSRGQNVSCLQYPAISVPLGPTLPTSENESCQTLYLYVTINA